MSYRASKPTAFGGETAVSVHYCELFRDTCPHIDLYTSILEDAVAYDIFK